MLFNRAGITVCNECGMGWFRIFGFGLSYKDTTKHPLLFSERNGYSKGLRIGKYIIHPLVGWRSNGL